jgi:cation diffusion facilitator family transporter
LGKFAHDHDHGISGSIALTSERGIWAIKISFVGLMITALMQVVIVYFSSSVALLADTIHNFGDAATAVPLWIAFTLSRRPRTRRYNYGFNRAEDLAGVVVIGLILFSAIVAGYEAIDRFFNPRVVEYLGWVAAAAIIGFIGNEAVAIFRIRVGREIGSAALIADGLHARIDGLTSLAVLVGAIGVWAGFPLADPIIGLIITFAILRITWNATKSMWYRMMDAVEPEVVDTVENTALAIDGVQDIHDVRCRWVGHQLHASIHIEVEPLMNVAEGHQISEEVRHALFHVLPRLTEATVHMDPAGSDQSEFHQTTLHHVEAIPASEPAKTTVA